VLLVLVLAMVALLLLKPTLLACDAFCN